MYMKETDLCNNNLTISQCNATAECNKNEPPCRREKTTVLNKKKNSFCRSLIGRLLVLFSKRTEAVDIGWRSGGVETANKGASKRLDR